ncbi:nestin-like isoform X2 [Bolinopsis microptera]|uniref:nestin-like isoform X2 n=1 Tax=Bolinopsis microptera TaxID=2820187 RepID=UPI00307AD487
MEEIAERTEEAVDSVLLGADDVTHSLYDVTYDVVIKTSTFIASYLIYLLIMCIVLDFWDKLKEPTKQFLRSKIEKYVDQRTLTEFFKQYTDRRTKGQDRDTPPNQPVVENKNSLILAETQSEAQIITEQQVDAPASEEWDSASQENYDDPVTAAEVSEVDDKETVVEKEDFDQIAAVVEKDDEIQVGNLVDIEDDSQIAAVEKEDEDQISAVVDEVQLLVDVDDQVTAVEKEDEDQISAVVEKEDDVQVLVEVVDQVTAVEKEDDQIAAVVEKEDDVQVLVEVDDQVTRVGGEDDQISAVVDDVQLLVQVDVDDQVTAVEKEDDQIAAVVEKEDDVQVLVEVDDQVTPVGGEDDQISAVVDDVQLLVEVDDQVTPVEGEDDQIAAVVEKEDVDHITAVVEKKYDVQEENLVDIEDDSQIAAVESETGRGQDNCEDISGVIEEDNQLVSGDKDKPLSEAEVEIFVQDTISKAVQQYQSEEQSKDA